MQTSLDYLLLKRITLGQPQVLRHVGFIPLLLEKGSVSHPGTYLAAPDALAKGQLHIQESGSVPKLSLRNDAPLPVFLPAGMYLKGGGQDRMAVVSMVIPAQCAGEMPVRCIEKRRWDPSSQEAYSSPDHGAMAGSTMIMGSEETEQRTVWDTVDTISETTQTRSGSARLGDAYQQTRSQREDFRQAFALPPDHSVVGAAFYVATKDKNHLAIDVFGQAVLLETFFNGLRDSAALTAVSIQPSAQPLDVSSVVSEVRDALAEIPRLAKDHQDIPSSRGMLWAGSNARAHAAILEDEGYELHILYRRN